MSFCRNDRRTIALAAAVAGLMAMPAIAAAEDKIYPPGTDCANQPTIVGRLLCGRQEYRRQHGVSVEQPTVAPETRDNEPFPDPPSAQMEERLDTPQQLQPNTASPKH